MKITRAALQKIIKEEYSRLIIEKELQEMHHGMHHDMGYEQDPHDRAIDIMNLYGLEGDQGDGSNFVADIADYIRRNPLKTNKEVAAIYKSGRINDDNPEAYHYRG